MIKSVTNSHVGDCEDRVERSGDSKDCYGDLHKEKLSSNSL